MKYLGHEKVIVRFISLYLLGLTMFFAAWTFSYLLLPEGMLGGIGILGRLAGDTAADAVIKEFALIFSLNLIGFGAVIVGNLILRVKFFSFGYLIPLAWMMIYGVLLGTNSFSIPMEQAMAPSLAVFGRSGLYEMMSFVLLAAATNSISLNQSESFRSKSKPVPGNERWPMKKEQWVGVAIAILLLAGAAMREAYMIVL